MAGTPWTHRVDPLLLNLPLDRFDPVPIVVGRS